MANSCFRYFESYLHVGFTIPKFFILFLNTFNVCCVSFILFFYIRLQAGQWLLIIKPGEGESHAFILSKRKLKEQKRSSFAFII